MPQGRRDWSGEKVGKWTVLEQDLPVKRDPSGVLIVRWWCRCECGTVKSVRAAELGRGEKQTRTKIMSCGCALKPHQKALGAMRKKHGCSMTRIYRIYSNMLTRCNNSNSPSYVNYGGRGIKICEEWSNFESFRDWAISAGYSDELTIERKDVNGNYCPENCTWITPAEQGNNRRDTRYVTAWGETKTFKEWVVDSRCAIAPRGLRWRLNNGWDAELALQTPSIKKDRSLFVTSKAIALSTVS